MTTLLLDTKFSHKGLIELRKQFTTAVNHQKVGGSLQVSKERLIDLLLVVFPHLVDLQHQLERMTGAFDLDGNGTVDFNEFVLCLNKFNSGTYEEKMRLEFDSWDIDGKDGWSMNEFQNYWEGLYEDTVSNFSFLQATADSLDLKGDGNVLEKDLKAAIAREHSFRQYFTNHLALFQPDQVACLSELATFWGSYGLIEILALADKLSLETKQEIHHLKASRFWELCVDYFKPSDEAKAKAAFLKLGEHFIGYQFTEAETGAKDPKLEGTVHAQCLWATFAGHASGGTSLPCSAPLPFLLSLTPPSPSPSPVHAPPLRVL
jgi:Ca2+-binding EF-hand superfamily protein